jgi:hypothetical protein
MADREARQRAIKQAARIVRSGNQFLRRSFSTTCPYCFDEARATSVGCDECSGTGKRYRHRIRVEGGEAIVNGNAPLTPESEAALADVLRAAFKRMEE